MLKKRSLANRDIAACILLLIAIIAWFRADIFGHELLAQISILAIFAMSLDLLTGYTGLVSLGHAAFYGVGAYATAGLANLAVWPMWAVMPTAMLLAALLAVLAGAFAVRLVGVFFIMITLAIGEMVHAFAFRSRVFGGDDGLGGVPRLNLDAFGINLIDPSQFSLFTLIVAALVYFVAAHLVDSPFGRVLTGIHQNESRMRALGCPVRHYKLAAFVLSASLAGLAGSLAAQHNNFVSPELLTWTTSGEALIVVIIGGIGSLVGPAAGAAVFVMLAHHLSGITDYWMFFMGLFFVAVVLFGGDGLYGFIGRMRRALTHASR